MVGQAGLRAQTVEDLNQVPVLQRPAPAVGEQERF
jgi:hypothetical protein